MINLMDLNANKVSTCLDQYTIFFMGDTGVGKTTSMMKFLTQVSENGKQPLFLEFEDRFQTIDGIMAIKINSLLDLKMVLSQLQNPALKEKFSCIVIDTLDKFEELLEVFITQRKGVEILKEVGAWGEGSTRYKANLRIIDEIRRLGWTVHFIAQSVHNKDEDKKIEYDSLKLSKATKRYCNESANMVGYLSADEKGSRFVTFEPSKALPDLKNVFNLKGKINIEDLKDVWEEAITSQNGKNTTSEKTIKAETKTENFEDLKAKVISLGEILAKNDRMSEATNVLQKNLGVDENGNIQPISTLIDTQIEVVKVIAFELEELIKKYKIKA